MAESNDVIDGALQEQALLKVVVGIIFNSQQEVLVAKRPENVHLSGYWEFPGGKIEAGESSFNALKRELQEEIGISITQASYLFTISHAYPENHVQLDVWQVESYHGQAYGCEQQEVHWVGIENLGDYRFLSANQQILKYLRSFLR